MPEGADRVRPVDDRHQERIAGLVRIRAVFLAPFVIDRFFRCVPGLCYRIVVLVSAENGIALVEEVCNRIDFTGRVAAVDHLKTRKAVFIG